MNMHSNKFSKIISILISVSMLMSMCVSITAFADDRIYADPEVVTYMPSDTADIGEYKLYMQESYASGYYAIRHFLRSGEMYPYVVAMAWPPTLRTRTDGDGYPAQKATINNSNNTLTSTATGITYKLPDLNAPTAAEISSAKDPTSPSQFHKKEALIIDRFGVDNMPYSSRKSATVPINDKFDKISLLIGVGKKADYGKSTFHFFVTYTDGTTSLPEGATVSNPETKTASVTFPSGTENTDAADGRNGYVCKTAPLVTAAGQTAANNFVADFESYTHQPGAGISSSNTAIYNYTANFVKSTGNKASVAAYEYTLDVDETKTVKSITFAQKIATGSSGYVVLGMVGQKIAEDWTDRVAEINADIDNLTAEGAQITADAIIETLTAINEAKNKGVGEYIKIDEFNTLITDELVNDLFEGTNVTAMSWDDQADFLPIIDSIYYAVENTENNVSVVTKEWMTDAYSSMIDSLIEEDEKDEEDIMGRFELLKGATASDFQNIFEQKVLYETGLPVISAGNEVVTLEVDFSQPIRSSQLVKDNFTVMRGNEEINPKWITLVPKMTGEDITGVKVNVLNTQEYEKPYVLEISRDFVGANGGRWAYQFDASLNTSAPVSANTAGVTIGADNSVSGNVVLNSILPESQSYVVLISCYDDKGMHLGTLPTASMSGTILSGGSANVAVSGTLPQDTSKVICYIVDSFANMSLLTPPVTLK